MNRKKQIVSILLILSVLFCVGCTNPSNPPLAKNEDATEGSLVEKDDTSTAEDSQYEKKDAYVKLEFVNEIPYSTVKEFDITIYNYSSDISYCMVSPECGSVSTDKMYLEKENEITYYLPDSMEDLKRDWIVIEYYDQDANLIQDSKISVTYNSDANSVQIFEIQETEE